MIDPQELSSVDARLHDSPDVVGQECNGCYRILLWKFFNHDSSRKTGYKPTCIDCLSRPKLSMEEHLSKMSTENYNSEAVRKQRHDDQAEFRREEARWGKTMLPSDFLVKLHRVIPNLFVAPGGFRGDVSLYLIASGPRADWGGKNYKYMGYFEFDTMPEHSIFEFDEDKDVLVRATSMGWRSVLLRFIKAGVLTEQQCEKEFGQPSTGNSNVWFKQLQSHYNAKRVEETAA